MEYLEKDFQMFQDSAIIDFKNMSVEKSESLEIKLYVNDPVEYAMNKVPEKRENIKIRWFESCRKNEDHCLCCIQYPKMNSKNIMKKAKTYKCYFCDIFCENRESRKNHVENEHQDRKRKGLDGHWRYQCDYCHYESKIGLFLYNHESRCPKSIIFKCEMCEFGSSRKTNFIVHMKTIHNINIPMFKRQPKPIFKCSHCNYTTHVKANIQKHISKEHSRNTFQCDLCPFQSMQLKVFVKHQSIHSVSTFQCEVCSFQTQSELGFKCHVKIHENVNNFQCEVCSYQTESELGLNSHRSNHDKVMVKCVKCDYESLTKTEMILHKKIHNGKYQTKETKCEQCGFSPQGSKLRIRIKRLHLHRCDPFKCEFCDFDSNLIGFVHQHKKDKHKESIYPCNVCSYKSKRKSNVVKHTQTVHEGFRISCEQCQKKFTQDSDLRHHMESFHGVKFVSNKVKYLACKECGYKSNIRTVSKNHKCEPLKCQLCTFDTRFEFRMKLHMRKEHIEIKYNCNRCEYKTASTSKLARHKITMHEGFGSKLDCSDCGIRVVTVFDLRIHFSTVHGANSSEELIEMNKKNEINLEL